MTDKKWEVLQVCYCQHVGENVNFEAQVVHPAEVLPDQGPRVMAHRCSRGVACSLEDKPACVWAGTNPTVDPFEG